MVNTIKRVNRTDGSSIVWVKHISAHSNEEETLYLVEELNTNVSFLCYEDDLIEFSTREDYDEHMLDGKLIRLNSCKNGVERLTQELIDLNIDLGLNEKGDYCVP